jgi:hypothetical protein
METASTPETSVNFFQSTRRNTLEGRHLNSWLFNNTFLLNRLYRVNTQCLIIYVTQLRTKAVPHSYCSRCARNGNLRGLNMPANSLAASPPPHLHTTRYSLLSFLEVTALHCNVFTKAVRNQTSNCSYSVNANRTSHQALDRPTQGTPITLCGTAQQKTRQGWKLALHRASNCRAVIWKEAVVK